MGSRDVNESVENQISDFLKQHGRTVLGLFVLALVVHDIFGTHGFIAMRRTQLEIQRVRKDIDRLNSENVQLSDQVKALKSDPHAIERIAREELQRAKPGEVIIRVPQLPQPTDAPPKP
ncbi:MAG TPA: septum formation initiator family protein [Candidatus Sulfotelmatobacter sp.]|nr:septum formation initiator family protein [Candidatus Sulfotelmatobacter sp.]